MWVDDGLLIDDEGRQQNSILATRDTSENQCPVFEAVVMTTF